jgi:hypothetical protein
MLINSRRSILIGRQSVQVATTPRSTSFWELWRATNTSRSVWTKDFWCLFDSTTLHLCSGQISRLFTACMVQFLGMKLRTSPSSRKTQIAKFPRTSKNRTLLDINEIQRKDVILSCIVHQFVQAKSHQNIENDRSKVCANSDGWF